MNQQEGKIRKGILVVDDDPDIRLVCRDRLEYLGYRVYTADNGHQALAVLSVQDLHGVLLDLHLPGLSGVDVLHLVREQGLRLPILLMSAEPSRTAEELVLAKGTQGFLLKPLAHVALDFGSRNGWGFHKRSEPILHAWSTSPLALGVPLMEL